MAGSATDAGAPVDVHKTITACQNNLRETAQLLSSSLAAMQGYFDEQAISQERRVALLDLENAVDSKLLSLNTNYVLAIEALSKASVSDQDAARAAEECQARAVAASEADNDLDAIMNIYRSPLDTTYHNAEAYADVASIDASVKLDQYKDFSRVVFRVHDAGARAPSSKEALSAIDATLQEQQLLAQEEEDGLEVGESVVRPICLISSRILEEPVRASCGHYFSHVYITDVIRRNGGGMTCPSRGCHNVINEKQLVRDRMMDLKVSQYLRREEIAKQLEAETVGRVA